MFGEVILVIFAEPGMQRQSQQPARTLLIRAGFNEESFGKSLNPALSARSGEGVRRMGEGNSRSLRPGRALLIPARRRGAPFFQPPDFSGFMFDDQKHVRFARHRAEPDRMFELHLVRQERP